MKVPGSSFRRSLATGKVELAILSREGCTWRPDAHKHYRFIACIQHINELRNHAKLLRMPSGGEGPAGSQSVTVTMNQ